MSKDSKMKNEYPLRYFESILQLSGRLTECKDLIDFQSPYMDTSIISIDEKKKSVRMMDVVEGEFGGIYGEEIDISFADLAKREIDEQKVKAIQEITENMMTVSIDVSPTYLFRIQQTLKSLVEKFDTYYSKNKELIILKEGLHWILEELRIRYKDDFQALEPDNKKAQLSESAKLKWNAGISTLGTMFYELNKLKQENGEPYFHASTVQLGDFIESNFVDTNGNTFSRVSLMTYIRNNAKKAKKDRIDINKLMPKDKKK